MILSILAAPENSNFVGDAQGSEGHYFIKMTMIYPSSKVTRLNYGITMPTSACD